MKIKPRSVPVRGLNFDFIMWLVTRLTALGMYLVALVGLTAALWMGARQDMNMADLMRWVFMANPNHVANTAIPDVEAWKGLFWQVMGILMLLFAGMHGIHGLLNVIEDYLSSSKVRVVVRLVGLLVWGLMTAVGVYVILTS
jgi:succinate dehydrogenase hydrophobic anchor subunit